MANPVLETLADVAKRERRQAVRKGEYAWAFLSAVIEACATNAARESP